MEKDVNVTGAAEDGATLWEQVCRAYGFGPARSAPQPVSGGLQHRIWRLDTPKGAFAVKLLHAGCAADAGCCRRCCRGEQIARWAAEAGLPAVAALDGAQGLLQRFGQAAIFCYRWEEGAILPPTPALPMQADRIGALLGRLHGLALPWEPADLPDRDWFPPGHWALLADRAARQNLVIASALQSAQAELLAWNEATREAARHLRKGWVVSHRDLDQKNVLWRDAATPLLLDWEAAGPVHPALEVMGAALNWAGQSAGTPDETVFRAFLGGYCRHAPLDADALRHAADAVLGKWLVWLDACLRRALAPGPGGLGERTAATDAAAHALATLRVLAAALLSRLAWCDAKGGA